jgi:hypothetical protein
MSNKSKKNKKAAYEGALETVKALGGWVDILATPGDEDLAGFRQEIVAFVDFVVLKCYPQGSRIKDEYGNIWTIYRYDPEHGTVIPIGFNAWLLKEEGK